MNKIIKTPKAKLDLIDLASYLYNADPMSDASERFLEAAENAFARVADFPGVGVAYSSAASSLLGLRRWPIPGFRNYLVFYRSVGADVEIVRVLHAARDINTALEEDDDK